MEENLICPICGGLHPAGHRDRELEEKLEAIKKYVDHIEYGGHVIRQPDVAEASRMIAQRLREILVAEVW